ncbi:putative transporter [Prevotella sp. E13-17]|uniref:putative transporter n=1 Tax=Prevotella sp. E13-17 TaxID=2913616 RepID=UPI001EDC49E0|nr:putative transporter [Prevotella sp. E13-17]UKK49779.1 putative transporter [Prevotella sp. E13-17]
MEWFVNLFTNTESVAHIAILYAIVIAVGVYLGKIKIFGISLGVTFVLFAGIVLGHIYHYYGLEAAPTDTLTFVQDFGLILFVFMIGLQVGPGFFESFGKAGIKLNALAASAIALNIVVMFACYFIFFYSQHDNTNLPMMVGTLYGAVTNTPGLGAANEALASLKGVFGDNPPQIASAYACAYPLGVLGIIGATIVVRYICRVKLEKEEEALEQEAGAKATQKPHHMHLEVSNKYLEGKTVLQVHNFLNRDFVVSRILHEGHVSIPNRDTVFHVGDQMYIVCAEADYEAIVAFIGPVIEVDWDQQDQPLVSKRVLVTNPKINGKSFGQMHFSSVYGVNVTRVTRHGMDIFASPSLPLQVGDRIMVVGPQDAVDRVAHIMGNSIKRLDAPNIATIFIGIIVGIIFGSLPFVPGMPLMKLGIAGGPLIIAILIGRYGYKVKLVTYTTTSANMMLREIGLVLFLASVGIKAGANFFDTVMTGNGVLYVLTGFLITIIPILIIGPIARRLKFNYFTIAGMLAGTYTDPPALAYANSICSKEAPAVGYSTVYPLAMFLRILTAQLIVLFCCGQF